LSVYGKSKLAGELAVSSLAAKHWILRASWVFSEHGGNFVKTMLRLATSQSTLRVVSDQFGTPTYAGGFAASIVALMRLADESKAPPWGTYHTVGGPTTTWCDFAREIVERAHARGLIDRLPEVEPIATSDYPTAAARPIHAVLEPSQQFIRALGVDLDWQAGLDVMLERLVLAE
jgi:dTDP-4-dehydrorhamnose reductase